MQFDIAEVLPYDSTYWHTTGSDSQPSTVDGLFSIRVRSCSAYVDRDDFIARPFANNLKSIPLVGELVLLVKTYNQYSSNTKTKDSWYYLQTLNIQSDINENRIPGISVPRPLKPVSSEKPAGKTFSRKVISPLQPFEGDQFIEGRFGNSIRLGSTITTIPDKYYFKSPNWTGETNGDPILILANGQTNLENKQFVVEDINQDNSSLYLTSTQEIPLTFSGNTPNNINTPEPVSNFIGVADRVILRAKKDRTIIDSENDIILNTTADSKVKIGGDTDMTPIPEGDQLVNVLNKIAQILAQGNLVQGSIASPIATTSLVELNSMIEKIKSKNFLIKKNS
jgi:hypothetical protein